GMAPLKVIRQKYGASVKQEILSDLVQRSYGQAIVQEKLKPAGMPHIDAKPTEPGKDVEFTAVFEVYPEIKLGDLQKLKIQQPAVEIQPEDVEKMLDKLRRQRAQWVEVARSAHAGDQIKIDFAGTIDEQAFEGGSAENFPLVLGSKQMVEGFEEPLVGITAGEERTVKVKFPKDYAKSELQGKKAQFRVSCKAVLEQKLPEVDAEFIKSFGVQTGGPEELKNELRQHMERELVENSRSYIKRQLMDGLLEMHKIDLPDVLVDQEIQHLQQQTLERMGIQNADKAQLPKEPFEEQARRRVALALLFTKITEEQQIKPDAATVKAKIEQLAGQYEHPEQVVQYYMSNKGLLRQIESLVVEDQIVSNLLAQAKTSKKDMRFSELIEANQKTA
ncbi:MAG TPA: trigger factor, partial [Gammaproteobacteria bacterium]